MAQATAAEKAPVTPSPLPQGVKKKPISEECLELEEQTCTGYTIFLPAGWALDDLKDPANFKQLQSGSRPLRVLDRVTICDFEMTWFVEARVAGASEAGVSLAITARKDLPQRNVSLPEIEHWRLIYCKGGYAVQHKASRLTDGQTYVSLQTAQAALYSKAPRVIS